MVQEPIYLNLSSSSDEDDEENNRGRDGPTSVLYLAKVFNMDVDDDDVRIIDKPASNGKVKRNRARVVRGTLDDDDCCILDTDPGAADAVPDVVSSHNTDELVMTGEKGPVACRDFPHARYLCVHFPFKSTLHSNYCAQCHCYVCDSLAPCSLWGEGNNPKDHCHASEEPPWKSLRKIEKYRSFSSVAAPTTRSADQTGESRLVQTTLLQTLPSCALSITPVTPVESPGVVLRVPTTVKRDPLVIQLKGKGRGKVSQPPQLLGVKNVRCKTNSKKSAPGSLVPRSTSPPPFGRAKDEPPLTALNSTSRLRRSRGRVPSVITPDPEPPLITPRPGRPVPATTPSHSQPPHTTPNPNFRPGRAGGGISSNTSALPQSPLDTPNPRLGRAGGPVPTTVPNPNVRLGRAIPSTTTPHSRSMRSSNSLPNRAVAASPPHQGRNTLPSRAGGVAITKPTVQQLPQPTLISNSAPTDAATSYIPPPVTINDLQAPSVSAGQRYVSAGPLRDQQVSDVSIDPLSEGHSSAQSHWPTVVSRSDFVAHDSRSAVDNASSSHRGVTVDILAGPIEGWEMDAAADFNSLTPEHVPSSLNDVIQQMAADDYLWEPPYPGWQ